jgi:2-polyprenyl-3-methyl-5-hydroxy-6-metoxy-1,4-benzoquinol methylase
VLELAYGTGRVTIPVFESGIDVDGIDFSESMLSLVRKHAEAKSLKISFFKGDLRSLPFDNQYDLMYMPTATICHLLTRIDVEAFLRGARRGLHPSGILALDMHNEMKIFLKSWPLDPSPSERSFTRRVTGETIRVSTTQEYSAASQIFVVTNHYTFADGSARDGNIVCRLYFPAELEDLLHYNGFDIVHAYGDYKWEEFNSDSERYVVLAKPRV